MRKFFKAKRRRRATALLLATMLAGTSLPGVGTFTANAEEVVTAAYTDGLCEHHPSHDSDCGYTEATPCHYGCEICTAQDSGQPEDNGQPQDKSQVDGDKCSCETSCTEETAAADCPVCGAEGADLTLCVGAKADPAPAAENETAEDTEEKTEEKTEEETTPSRAEQVQAQINALPTLDKLQAMTDEEQQAAYMEIQKAYESYEALSDEEKAQIIGAEELESLLSPAFAMQIFVEIQMPNGQIALEVERTNKIEDIKAKIQDKKGIFPERQHLFFDGSELDNEKTIGDYNIQLSSILQLKVDGNGGEINADTNTQEQIDTIFGAGNAALTDGHTITLKNDVTVISSVQFKSGEWTLDLGGHTLKGNKGEDKRGDVLAGPGICPVTVTGGTLTVRNGTFQGGDGGISDMGGNGGNGLLVKGGTVTIDEGVAIKGGAPRCTDSATRPDAGGGTGLEVAGNGTTVEIVKAVSIKGGDSDDNKLFGGIGMYVGNYGKVEISVSEDVNICGGNCFDNVNRGKDMQVVGYGGVLYAGADIADNVSASSATLNRYDGVNAWKLYFDYWSGSSYTLPTPRSGRAIPSAGGATIKITVKL